MGSPWANFEADVGAFEVDHSIRPEFFETEAEVDLDLAKERLVFVAAIVLRTLDADDKSVKLEFTCAVENELEKAFWVCC